MTIRRVLLAVLVSGGGLVGVADPPAANAAYTVTFSQVGADVVASGSGSLDLTGLLFAGTEPESVFVRPNYPAELTGSTTATAIDIYGPVTGPNTFGPGDSTFADLGSGDPVGLQDVSAIAVPQGYASGVPLVDSATYLNQSLASLGLTPGTYVWSWSSDTFTIDVLGSTPVPEPGAVALLSVGLLGLASSRRGLR